MIASTRTVWVASLVVLAAVAVSRPVWAESRNQIRAITFSEDSGTTKVRIAGSEVATFTVYKLERPSRVVLDVARAELSDELRGHEAGVSLAANTWAVGTVGAQPLVDGGNGVRVIIALARPGRYDVKIDGKDLLVLVAARDAAPAAGDHAETRKAQAAAATAQRALAVAEQSKTDADRSRVAAEQSKTAAEKARKEAEREAQLAKSSATSAQKEAERLRAVAAEQAARAERAEQQAQASAAGDRKREAAAAAARQDAARAHAEAEAARVAAAAAQKEMERTRVAVEEAKRKGQQALERDRKALAAERAAVEAERQQVSAQKAQLAKDSGDAERLRAEAEAARKAAAAERKEVSSLRQAAQAKLDDAEKKLGDANAKLDTANAQLATLDQKTAAARQLQEEAQAVAQRAAAQKAAAEQAERAAARAQQAAEAEVARAVAAAGQSKNAAASAAKADKSAVAAERARLAREAQAAEARLAEVRRKAAAAEAERAKAEQAAALAKAELDDKQRALTSLEAQRQGTEEKIRDAATRQARAEAAAQSAGERKQKAESEALSAERTRAAAEAAARQAAAQRVAAETASRAAEEQRIAAETASRAAETQRAAAEGALAELAERRRQAARAEAELEERRTAEAEAAQARAAQADRQQTDRASKAERERATAEATRLAAARQRAETELRARAAAVKDQAKEVDRLKAAAATARAEAEREELRRAQLAERRVAEERELERLRKQVATAAPAPAPVTAPAPRNHATLVAMAPTRAAPPSAPPPAKAAAPAKAAPAKLATVTDISFHADDVAPRIDIAISGDAEVREGAVTARRAELIIDDVKLADQLERKLDVTRFGGTLRSISSFRDRKVAGRVHLVVDLARPATVTLQRRAGVVGWHFASSPGQVAQPTRRAPRTQNIPPPVIGGFGSGASTPIAQQAVTQVNNRRRKVYRGPTVELDFKEAPIHDLLRLLSDVGKVNIVVPDEVDAKVTVRMKRVPWDQALEVILASKGLWYRQEGNLIRVAQRKALDEEDEAEAARRAAAVQAEAPRPDVITLNYASAEALRSKLAPLLSPKGKIEVDERTNALLVNDVRANREEVRALALQLDTQTPQISIEARIVEARSTFTREIGVQWGGRATAGPDGGNATGLLFPSSIGLAGGAEDDATVRNGVATPSDFAVNLPAAVGSGAGGALGISLGSIGGNYNINLRLSALEGTGSVRIVSAPKITVLNNTEARISQGVSIPIQVLSAQGTNTVFVPADLALTVKPYVSLRDCAIAMELNVTKNEPDFVNTGARGDPTILRKEARTTLLVADGETSVLGGIYTRNAGLSYSKVPFFGDLPVLGWFFKNRSETDQRTEVLVFITPKITNKAFLRCQNEPK